MTAQNPVPTIGRVRVSRICFHTDVGSRHGRIIPLGVISEIELDDVHGLGIIARTDLEDDELRLIGGLLREKLRSPFLLLLDDFEWAWANSRAGECLSDLANRHQAALRFDCPSVRALTCTVTDEDAAMEMARKKLIQNRDREFWSLIHELHVHRPPHRGLDDFQYAAAA